MDSQSSLVNMTTYPDIDICSWIGVVNIFDDFQYIKVTYKAQVSKYFQYRYWNSFDNNINSRIGVVFLIVYSNLWLVLSIINMFLK